MAEFNVGVSVSVNLLGLEKLQQLSSQVSGINNQAQQLSRQMERTGESINAAFSVAALHGFIRGMERLLDIASKLSTEMANLRVTGYNRTQIENLTREALRVSVKVPDISAVDVMAEQRKIGQIIGPKNVNEPLLTAFTRSASVIEGITHEGIPNIAGKMMQAVESIGNIQGPGGQFDPHKIENVLAAVTRGVVVAGGNVNAEQAQRAMALNQKWFQQMPPTENIDRRIAPLMMLLEQLPSTGGSIFNSLNTATWTGTLAENKKSFGLLQQLGMWKAGGPILPGRPDEGGRPTMDWSRSLRGFEEVGRDMARYIQGPLLAAFRAHADPSGRFQGRTYTETINLIYANQRARTGAVVLASPQGMERTQQYQEALGRMPHGENALGEMYAESISFAKGLKAFKEGLADFIGVASSPFVETAARVLFALGQALHWLAEQLKTPLGQMVSEALGGLASAIGTFVMTLLGYRALLLAGRILGIGGGLAVGGISNALATGAGAKIAGGGAISMVARFGQALIELVPFLAPLGPGLVGFAAALATATAGAYALKRLFDWMNSEAPKEKTPLEKAQEKKEEADKRLEQAQQKVGALQKGLEPRKEQAGPPEPSLFQRLNPLRGVLGAGEGDREKRIHEREEAAKRGEIDRGMPLPVPGLASPYVVPNPADPHALGPMATEAAKQRYATDTQAALADAQKDATKAQEAQTKAAEELKKVQDGAAQAQKHVTPDHTRPARPPTPHPPQHPFVQHDRTPPFNPSALLGSSGKSDTTPIPPLSAARFGPTAAPMPSAPVTGAAPPPMSMPTPPVGLAPPVSTGAALAAPQSMQQVASLSAMSVQTLYVGSMVTGNAAATAARGAPGAPGGSGAAGGAPGTTSQTMRTTSQTMIGGERFVPGQPLSPNQMGAVQFGTSMGNQFPPAVMQQFNRQHGGASPAGRGGAGGRGAGHGGSPTSGGRMSLGRSGSAPVVGVGSGNAADALTYFKTRGWTDAQSKGIVANLMSESKLRPGAVGDAGAAYGIGQWHKDRQGNFKQVFGHDIRQSTVQEQLAFVDWELRNTEKRAGQALGGAQTARQSGGIVSSMYERPANRASEMASRGSLAETLKMPQAQPASMVTPPMDRHDADQRYVMPPAQSHSMQMQADIHLDGQVIASHTFDQMFDKYPSANSGPTAFDKKMNAWAAGTAIPT